MVKRKRRTKIPPDIAAKVLFLADRTCCVCRIPGKPIQIHHIDDNPSNNTITNLAVLCFDCHRETQIRGGFDRKLDSEQIILYRNDWNIVVSLKRASSDSDISLNKETNEKFFELVTSLGEIYRENKEHLMLAHHYHNIGNKELRDKYIELALENNPTDYDIVDLRALQGRVELIPNEVIAREKKRYT